MQVIYEPKDRGSEALSRYVKELVDDGNHVVNAVETGYGLVSMKELNSRTQGFMMSSDLELMILTSKLGKEKNSLTSLVVT